MKLIKGLNDKNLLVNQSRKNSFLSLFAVFDCTRKNLIFFKLMNYKFVINDYIVETLTKNKLKLIIIIPGKKFFI